MSRKIKLIWDFRGPASAKTAEHHEIHLKEYITIKKLPINITGFQIINEMYAIAFMVVKGTGQSKFDLDTLGRKREISFSEKMFTNRHWIIAVLALLLMMGLVVWQRLDA